MPTGINLVPNNTGSAGVGSTLGTEAKKWDNIYATTGSIDHIEPYLNSLNVRGNITASGGIKADSFESVTGGTGIDFSDDLNVTGHTTISGDSTVGGDLLFHPNHQTWHSIIMRSDQAHINNKQNILFSEGPATSSATYPAYPNGSNTAEIVYHPSFAKKLGIYNYAPTGMIEMAVGLGHNLILTGSKVGIGTYSIPEALSVSGSISATGHITASVIESAYSIIADGGINVGGDIIFTGENTKIDGKTGTNTLSLEATNPAPYSAGSKISFQAKDFEFDSQATDMVQTVLSLTAPPGGGLPGILYTPYDIETIGHITASSINAGGGITASGHLVSYDEILLKRAYSGGVNLVKLHRLNNNGVVSVYEGNSPTIELQGQGGHITASGYISASNINQSNKTDIAVNATNTATNTTDINRLLTESGSWSTRVTANSALANSMQGGTGSFTNITASGGISVSGDITASGDLHISESGRINMNSIQIGNGTVGGGGSQVIIGMNASGSGGCTVVGPMASATGWGTAIGIAAKSWPTSGYKTSVAIGRLATVTGDGSGLINVGFNQKYVTTDDTFAIMADSVDLKLGINTVTPSEALEVIGNISASGDLFANDLTLSGNVTALSGSFSHIVNTVNSVVQSHYSASTFSGSVFISGSTPGYPAALTVDGDISASGDLYVAANSIFLGGPGGTTLSKDNLDDLKLGKGLKPLSLGRAFPDVIAGLGTFEDIVTPGLISASNFKTDDFAINGWASGSISGSSGSIGSMTINDLQVGGANNGWNVGGGSAYIKTTGYVGNDSSVYDSGIILYSGSSGVGNTPSGSYGGVGFEFVNSSTDYLRYTSSKLEVKGDISASGELIVGDIYMKNYGKLYFNSGNPAPAYINTYGTNNNLQISAPHQNGAPSPVAITLDAGVASTGKGAISLRSGTDVLLYANAYTGSANKKGVVIGDGYVSVEGLTVVGDISASGVYYAGDGIYLGGVKRTTWPTSVWYDGIHGLTSSKDISVTGHITASSGLLINKSGASSNEILFEIKEDGAHKFSVDEDGDIYTEGNLYFNNGNPTTPVIQSYGSNNNLQISAPYYGSISPVAIVLDAGASAGKGAITLKSGDDVLLYANAYTGSSANKKGVVIGDGYVSIEGLTVAGAVSSSNDIYAGNTSAKGVVLTSPDGTKYRLKVANGGGLTTETV